MSIRLVEIDLKTEDGVEALLTLADRGRWFYRIIASVIERSVSAYGDPRNPELSIAQSRPMVAWSDLANAPAYDHVVQAMSGIMSTTEPKRWGLRKLARPTLIMRRV